jgi:hypothetical protein
MTEQTQPNVKETSCQWSVRTYPHNELRDQVREFDDTLSAFHVIKKAFFNHK